MQQDRKPTYKYCIVPMCTSTNRNAPNKVFFLVPRGENIRRKWCKIMKRDMISPSTCLYCCEDHFNIEEDTANYIQYKIMNLQGKKTVLRLKKDIVPHKFQCQKNIEPQPSLERQANKNRKHLKIIEEASSAPASKQSASTPKLSELSRVDHIEASKSSSRIYTEDLEMNTLCEAGCSASLYTENKIASMRKTRSECVNEHNLDVNEHNLDVNEHNLDVNEHNLDVNEHNLDVITGSSLQSSTQSRNDFVIQLNSGLQNQEHQPLSDPYKTCELSDTPVKADQNVPNEREV